MTEMTAMADIARSESIAARAHWGIPHAPFKTAALDNIDHKLVPRVMSCLRAGLGVEDMQANGTCELDEARQVVSWMRENGSLQKFYEARASA